MNVSSLKTFFVRFWFYRDRIYRLLIKILVLLIIMILQKHILINVLVFEVLSMLQEVLIPIIS